MGTDILNIQCLRLSVVSLKRSISQNPENFGNSGDASISSTMRAKMTGIVRHFFGETDSAGIVEALPELPGLAKIS